MDAHDSSRIDLVLAAIREAWVKVPHWRLGQLIVNAVNVDKLRDACGEVYCMEDASLVKRIAAISAVLPSSVAAPASDSQNEER
jgi:hypothetical protein